MIEHIPHIQRCYWSGISTVVYGCSAAALARAAGDDFLAACHEVFARGERNITVVGPVLEEEGLAKHLVYWPGAASVVLAREG